MRSGPFVCVAEILLLPLLLESPVCAQTTYTNPYTGNQFNNPNSSLLDTAILGVRNQMMLNSALANGRVSSSILREAYMKQMRLGESKIKTGKATTRFTQRAFPLDYWVKQTGGTTPEKRKQNAAELTAQRAIWMQESRARNVDPMDMAQALGLTFVLAREAQTGDKATAAQFKGITNDFRTMLLKNPLYQGMDATGRQRYFEDLMINSTDPVRLLREAQRTTDDATRQKAQESGQRYVHSWLPSGFTRYETTPTSYQEVK